MTFFKQKSTVLFRNYESFGYITDNRNFGYKQINSNKIGDRIVSQSGSVFLSVLGRNPQSLNDLAVKINNQFSNVELEIIKKDAEDFYLMLEQEGFIVSGKSVEECNKKDTRFTYKSLLPESIKNDYSTSYPEKPTQEYFEEHFNGKPQLTTMHIEITGKCNERCLHCYIPHDNKVSDISPEVFYDVLEQCRSMKLLHLTISGGEPMLHKNFCDFLRKCHEYDFSVNVLSNLTLLNDEILKEMKANPLLGIQVSLYSMSPKIHDEITQMNGSFEKTKTAILKIIDNDIPIQISCPILKLNKNCYNDVKSWGKEHNIHVGIDYGIIAEYNHTTDNLSNRLSIDEIREVINDVAKDDSKYWKKIEKEAEDKKTTLPTDSICSVCSLSICLDESGNVYPCAGWQDYCVGNVKETSLSDIWNNSEKVKYLRGLCKQDFPKCIQCPEKEFCTMCMVRNSNEDSNGDIFAINEFFCNIARLNKEQYQIWKGGV